MNILTINHLTITYPGFHFYHPPTTVLQEVNLQIAEGEAVGLVGPNGAGKTTLFKTLLGLLTPTTGTLTVFDKPVNDPSLHFLIGYLPDQPAFYPFMTAYSLLAAYAKSFHIADPAARIQHVLEQVNLAGVHKKISQYSKGMIQRLGIAQAILHDPPLLLLDEPFSGLDPVGRADIHQMLQTLRTQGKTIIFSSHNLHDIETSCDRVAIIRQRRLETTRNLHELLTQTLHGIQIIIETKPEILPLLQPIDHTLTTVGNHFIISLPSMDNFNQCMTMIQQTQSNLISIHTIRQSLEEYFITRTEDSAS